MTKPDSTTVGLLVFSAMLIMGSVIAEAQTGSAATTDTAISVGERAPDFTLPGYPEESFTLSDHRGHTVVLFFYPGDNTPVCTAEAIGFTELQDDFDNAGAMLYGISRDSLESHEAFHDEHGLSMTLLSDTNGSVRRKFGNPDGSTPLASRVTYVIDSKGVVRHIVVSDDAEDHYSEALDWAERLAEETEDEEE